MALYFITFAYGYEKLKRGEEPTAAQFWSWHRGMIMGDDIRLSLCEDARIWWELNGKGVGESLCDNLCDGLWVMLEGNPLEGNHVMDSTFCAMKYFVMDSPFRWITFKLDWERQLDALVQGGQRLEDKAEECIRHAQRISALRNVTWADSTLRSDIVGVRDEYVRVCERELPQLKGRPEWELAKDILSDAALLKLYTGLLIPTTVRNEEWQSDTLRIH